MSDQRQKKRPFLSFLSSPFQGLRSRPPSPPNAVQASKAPAASTESVASSSRVTDNSQIVNECSDRSLGGNVNLRRPVAMFSDIERVHIGVGHFTQNINNQVGDYHILKSLPRSRDAAFSAAINQDSLSRRRCTEGTRVEIIAQIVAWMKENDPAKAPPVYWLTGMAGLGKTTIAYTICELLEEAQMPFASFFCSLQLDSRDSKLLVTTLCRDLAELYSSYAASIFPVLETNSKLIDAGLRIQINELLAKPWQASIAQRQDLDLPTPIVIVDALDENGRGSEFLEELLCVIHANQLAGIKFLVTSRMDPKIVNLCKSFPPNAVCKLHEVDTANVQNDIEKYLREALPELKDEPELALLSQRAGGLFIYATTAVRFISPIHSPPSIFEMRSHLQAMLNPDPLTSHDERLLVEELYERILDDAFRDVRIRATRLRILHTIICAESRIDISVLADLTNTDQGTVQRVVESLHAVLFVSSKDGCVYWYHASFPDFLFSRAQARISLSLHHNHQSLAVGVFCDEPAQHGVLAQRCLSVMHKSLHFNMCNLPSSYIFDCEVPDLNTSVDKTFSPLLRYVSRQWAKHLRRANPPQNDTDDLLCGLKDFLDNKLLFWIEAMNLIGAKSECFSLLKDAESWLEGGKKWPKLLGQLEDARNFSAFFAGSPASESTPHLYISALSVWDQDSPIWKKWRDRFGFIPSFSLPRGTVTIPLLTIPTGGSVDCIACSSDGDQIVSSSYEVWDAKTGKLLREMQGGNWLANSIAFSPDGNCIVAGTTGGIGWLWDAKTGEQLRKLRGHTGRVTSVAFSFDNNRVVSGSWDKSVRVWAAKTSEQLRVLQGHTGNVTSVAFSPDGNRIISGSEDKSMRVWNAKTGELLRKLRHTQGVTSVAFSPDGNRIVSGSEEVRVWDAKTGELLRELQGHTEWVTSVAFSPGGNRIVSGSEDTSVRVWDAKMGEQLSKLQGHTDTVTSVAFLPDGNRIVSGSEDKSVRVWAAKTGEQLRELQGHTGNVTSVAFSPDDNLIVSGSRDKSVRVWDARTGKQLRELPGHGSIVTSVAFLPDGKRIVSGSEALRLWDAKTGEQLKKLYTGAVTSVACLPDGNRIVFGSNNSVWVWDTKAGEQLRELQGHSHRVTSVAFSTEDRIVSGSWDKTMRVWNAKTGEQLKELQGHTNPVTLVAFSPDGNQVVSGSIDQSVRVWDAKTGKQLKNWLTELQGHTLVAFSTDGDRIISCSHNSVWVWDAKTGKRLRELQGHTAMVNSIGFSPDGNRIVSGSSDYSVRVWANLNLDASWTMGEDGWIISGADSEMLVWVPSTIHNILLRPHNTLILSRNGSATISFTQCKFGTFWHECYTP